MKRRDPHAIGPAHRLYRPPTRDDIRCAEMNRAGMSIAVLADSRNVAYETMRRRISRVEGHVMRPRGNQRKEA